ncbi:MAG: class I SAM-dependent methyltransferase, partial [Flavobacteriaceae bacterium]|nr:class I SAM-dependent methyltransferase [Flavobacteriaceae bacterium]
MLKRKIKTIIHFLGLLTLSEKILFFIKKIKANKKNSQFKKEHPEVILPPDFFMYETFALDYHKIYIGGLDTAEWVIKHFNNYFQFKNATILDWGCGSGRVL